MCGDRGIDPYAFYPMRSGYEAGRNCHQIANRAGVRVYRIDE